MEEPEVPTEHLQVEIEHHAHEEKATWTMGVALSSALLAALAALASLKAGHEANMAMITQIESANQWGYFQSKSIKESQLAGKLDILAALGKEPAPKDLAKAEEYKKEKAEIQAKAEELQHESKALMHQHEIMARAVTLFQVAIAVAAISALTKRRTFWLVSLVFGAVGAYFLVSGLLAVH